MSTVVHRKLIIVKPKMVIPAPMYKRAFPSARRVKVPLRKRAADTIPVNAILMDRERVIVFRMDFIVMGGSWGEFNS
jgi:hypothetical protein